MQAGSESAALGPHGVDVSKCLNLMACPASQSRVHDRLRGTAGAPMLLQCTGPPRSFRCSPGLSHHHPASSPGAWWPVGAARGSRPAACAREWASEMCRSLGYTPMDVRCDSLPARQRSEAPRPQPSALVLAGVQDENWGRGPGRVCHRGRRNQQRQACPTPCLYLGPARHSSALFLPFPSPSHSPFSLPTTLTRAPQVSRQQPTSLIISSSPSVCL